MVFCRRGWVCWLEQLQSFCRASQVYSSSSICAFSFRLRRGRLLLVGPIAAIASAVPRFGTLVGVGMAAGLWFSTPSSDHDATFNWLDALLVKGQQGIWIEAQLPKGTVHVIAPPSIGVPVAGARGGHFHRPSIKSA